MDGGGDVPNKAPLMPPRNIRRPGYEAYFPATADEVSLDEMLSLACRQGKQDIVELLLESGANVNHRNKAGNTPLLEACSQGHVDSARMLLDRGADIDTPTETTLDSALTWACTLGNERVVDLLLTQNTNVEHRTKDGCTALMFASLAGHVEVARMLLDHNAEINVESDSNKDSPLTFAYWKGHQDVVELLLERKADIEHRTKEGFTPLMFAALGGHKEVAHSLLIHGALVCNGTCLYVRSCLYVCVCVCVCVWHARAQTLLYSIEGNKQYSKISDGYIMFLGIFIVKYWHVHS